MQDIVFQKYSALELIKYIIDIAMVNLKSCKKLLGSVYK